MSRTTEIRPVVVTEPTPQNILRHLQSSDVRGIFQLASQATASVTRIAEGVHQSVLNTIVIPGGMALGLTRGITDLVYRSIHGGTSLLGEGVDTLLARLQPVFDSFGDTRPATLQREAVLAALNGVG